MIRNKLPLFKDVINWPSKFSILEMLILIIGIALGIFVYEETTSISDAAKSARTFEQQTRSLIIAVSSANIQFTELMQGNSDIDINNDVFSEFVIADSLCGYIDQSGSGEQFNLPPMDQSDSGLGPKTVCSQLASFRSLMERRWKDHTTGQVDSQRTAYDAAFAQLLDTLTFYNGVTDPRLLEAERKTRLTNISLSIGLICIFIIVAFIVRHTRRTLTHKTKQLEAEVGLRTRLNKDLDNERNLVNTLIDNIPDSVFAKDYDDRYLIANPAAAKVMGLAHKEGLIGKTDSDFQPEEIANRIKAEDNRILTAGETLHNKQSIMIDLQTGVAHWRQTTKVPLRNNTGQIIGLVGISRDISKQKEIEEALQKANEKLTQGIATLEQTTRETERVSEMVDLLQACPDTEEACVVIAGQMSRFFPNDSGILYLYHASRNILDQAASWGSPLPDPTFFKPDDCWGLRRGRMHIVQGNTTSDSHIQAGHSLVCAHIVENGTADYLCVPLVAQGEALGLMHLCHQVETTGEENNFSVEWYDQVKRQRITTIIDSLSLALANLKLRSTLRQQSIRDPLTGMFNRRYMEETLDREILRAKRSGDMIGLIMLDIDHYKKFNDTYGHQAGDVLLSSLGNFLQTHVRGEDVACRFGGEEFILVMPGAKLEPTQKRAEDIIDQVKNLNVVFQGQALGQITMSAGVAVFPANGATTGNLIQAVDQALYRAKTEGRDRVVVS